MNENTYSLEKSLPKAGLESALLGVAILDRKNKVNAATDGVHMLTRRFVTIPARIDQVVQIVEQPVIIENNTPSEYVQESKLANTVDAAPTLAYTSGRDSRLEEARKNVFQVFDIQEVSNEFAA